MMSHAPPLQAVTMTHIMYQHGDQLGHFLAWISLLPVFISLAGFLSHFIFRREIQTIFFLLGLFINQFISQFAKKLIRQPRPETCAVLEMCDTHGWPSSHSQYMFFFAVYFTLMNFKHRPPYPPLRTPHTAVLLPSPLLSTAFLLPYPASGKSDTPSNISSKKRNPMATEPPLPMMESPSPFLASPPPFVSPPSLAVVLAWILGFLTMWSRVYLGYHSPEQVVAGATFGVLLGGLWYWVVNYVLYDYFTVIEESEFGKIFYLKDTSHIQNVFKFEYDNARAAARKKMYMPKSDRLITSKSIVLGSDQFRF